MKKLYTLALAAFAALSASAQVYFVGEFNGVQMWTPDTPLEATLNADGNWEITLEKTGGFKMSTAMGDWDTFNAAAFSVNNGNVTEEFVGSFVDVVAWGENTNMPAQAQWKVEVTPDYKQVRFTQEGEAAAIEAYVVGGMETSNWGFVDLWKMTTVEKDKKYTFVCEGETMLPAGVEFKVAAPGWTMINYCTDGEALADGEPSECKYNEGANSFFSEDFTGTITLELTNGFSQAAELTFTPAGAGVEDVTVENNAKAVYYNLQGVQVANPEAGLYIVRRGDKVSKILVK